MTQRGSTAAPPMATPLRYPVVTMVKATTRSQKKRNNQAGAAVRPVVPLSRSATLVLDSDTMFGVEALGD